MGPFVELEAARERLVRERRPLAAEALDVGDRIPIDEHEPALRKAAVEERGTDEVDVGSFVDHHAAGAVGVAAVELLQILARRFDRPVLPRAQRVQEGGDRRELVRMPNPQRGPRRADYLGSTEWAWSPMHSRLDAYYLNRRRPHWLLWICSEDENSWDRRWRWYLYGYAPPLRISAEEAAIYMLLDCWKAEADGSSFDHFHWINDTGLLSVAEITSIGREVWPEARASLSE